VHINFLVVRQRAGDDLVAALAQYGDGLRADQAGVLSQTLDEDEREYHFLLSTQGFVKLLGERAKSL